ncbi:HD domain-containing protein [Actinomadura sp. NPDC048032]|uniref:HD domain-containing protein n=1 Tax=Actinomadura sp. NPDC048032 TaxID=3155747 RepID=UPI0033C5A65E
MRKNTAAWARDLARKHLETTLPRRWAHTQGVARQARRLALILGNRADLLEAAAWLHDIGYAPDLVDTGFHPLDGARYLRDFWKADIHLCRLVAHHSCAIVEANQRGLGEPLGQEFSTELPELSRYLIYCDMTTSKDGTEIEVGDRISEIQVRYGQGHPVSRSISESRFALERAVEETALELSKVAP